MKWLILALFLAASMTSLAWFEAAERSYTPGQKSACGLSAIATWALFFVLANTVL